MYEYNLAEIESSSSDRFLKKTGRIFFEFLFGVIALSIVVLAGYAIHLFIFFIIFLFPITFAAGVWRGGKVKNGIGLFLITLLSSFLSFMLATVISIYSLPVINDQFWSESYDDKLTTLFIILPIFIIIWFGGTIFGYELSNAKETERLKEKQRKMKTI